MNGQMVLAAGGVNRFYVDSYTICYIDGKRWCEWYKCGKITRAIGHFNRVSMRNKTPNDQNAYKQLLCAMQSLCEGHEPDPSVIIEYGLEFYACALESKGYLNKLFFGHSKPSIMVYDPYKSTFVKGNNLLKILKKINGVDGNANFC